MRKKLKPNIKKTAIKCFASKQKQKSEMKTIKNPTKQKQNQRNAKISIKIASALQ